MTVEIEGNETWIPESRVFVNGRKLTIPTLFVCDHEVTKGEYKAVMGNDPGSEYIYDKNDTDLSGDAVLNGAVSYVNWYDALVYCNKRSIKENLTPCYSINGSTDTSTWGAAPASKNETWDAAACNFEANGYRLPTEAEWEWCWDWYCSDPKPSTPASGETSGNTRNRRGGAVDTRESNCVLTYHDGDNPAQRGYSYGFRVVRTSE